LKGKVKMKTTLPNGMTIEGTPQQVSEVMSKLGLGNLLGDGTYYYSETHGPILIREMKTQHLRNAILKAYHNWLTNVVAKQTSARNFAYALINGFNDKTIYAMIMELKSRTD
jgi:hypothetical protein